MIQTSIVFPTNPDYELTDVVKQVLDMRTKALEEQRYGPFMLVHGSAWIEHMSKSYKHPNFPNLIPELTVKGRILKIEGIESVLYCDKLDNFDLVLVEVLVKSGDGFGDGKSFLSSYNYIGETS